MDFWTSEWSGPRASNKVYVIAERERDASVGLRTAERVAADLGRRVIVLTIPHLVPYGTELDRCGHSLQEIGDRFREVAETADVPTEVRVCACREAQHLFDRMLIDGAVVVVPGRRGRWRRSRSERLAHLLASQGHTVTFADVDRPADRTFARTAEARPSFPRLVGGSDARRRA
jgi:hypothetical protein